MHQTPPPLPVARNKPVARPRRKWVSVLSVSALIAAALLIAYTSGFMRSLRKMNPSEFRIASDAIKSTIITDIERNPGSYNPIIIILAAEYAFKHKSKPQAQFMYAFGTARLMYDSYRCSDPTSRGAVGSILINIDPELKQSLGKMPASYAQSIVTEALDAESKAPQDYDYKWAVQHGMDAMAPAFGKSQKYAANPLIPETEWPELRRNIHATLIACYCAQTKAPPKKMMHNQSLE